MLLSVLASRSSGSSIPGLTQGGIVFRDLRVRVVLFGALALSFFTLIQPVAAAADEVPPPIVEDFNYPLADQIFQQRGILLKKGDGNILLVDCVKDSDQIEVWSSSKGQFCFRVQGPQGYLTLELPQVYLLKGDSHRVQAEVIVKDRKQVVAVKTNGWTSVGEGSAAHGAPATLVELRASTP